MLSDRIGNRFWFVMYPIPITIVGYILFMNVTTFGLRYVLKVVSLLNLD